MAAVCCLLLSSCKENGPDLFANVKGTYFSINQFILDEWTNHANDMVSFQKCVKLNGKTDTSFTNVEKMDWNAILTPFIETDISDRKYLGRYTFTEFDNDFDHTHNYMYVAVNKELFTQKLLISIDMTTNKVKGVYLETQKKSFWNSGIQKLYYAPFKTIQIQQYDKPLIGSKKELVVQYNAM